ncbi:MAG: hypothetical protein EZS28_005757 [Streblomastix strix]|uniref:Uncharacterized protein n=1 Tax=Streblomastix strix TaxID=222440 RepID=A0A5J4WWU2_9EUKA|nr:MAG: hypothetical protein EZS28_005757 [Streblomastix strix]
MKATHLQQAGTIKETLLGNAVVPFTNDEERHYSIKEIKPKSQIPALFDKEIIISLSDTDHDITQNYYTMVFFQSLNYFTMI